jgi:hypothetical protein
MILLVDNATWGNTFLGPTKWWEIATQMLGRETLNVKRNLGLPSRTESSCARITKK